MILLLTPQLETATDELAFNLFLDDFLTELHTAQSYAVITGNGVNMDVVRPIGATHYADFKDSAGSDRYINRKLLLPEGSRVIQGYTGFIKGGSGLSAAEHYHHGNSSLSLYHHNPIGERSL